VGTNATQGENMIEVLGWVGIGFAVVWATLVVVDLLLMVLA
jgi:hypothetical protein